ncbi:HAD family hydrolase [Priestia taiwanensis]|uniref:MTA/SAH nucleosidase n=1 Tax=Priestia taiwanensis TaxID=1347902 RepID=A0A917AMH7_9BACI|nr:HAD hydrolase-like protein [Priestia taiwanensis]MBM7362229.1 adenosylhomocysteine nucleosidase [Priestia taiwanensis]GGE60479.1 MTA/SAH nucleosidase [Priestia taiwanensis]
MIKSLIFDMDGTLFQTDKILETALEDTFVHLRTVNVWDKETPIEKYREIMGVPLPVVWATLLPHQSKEIRHEANELFHEKLIYHIEQGNGALYPHVEEVFQQLKENGYHLYIASNGLVSYLQAIVAHYRLDKWVTETFSIEQIDSQNKSDLVGVIIQKYNIHTSAVIGDRLSDIRAAKDNGLISIGCRFDFAQENELAQADIVINSLTELNEAIERLNKVHIE